MIVKSYLVFPVEGQMVELISALEAMPECEVTKATNRNLVVLVTETDSEAAEKELEAALNEIPFLHALTLVSGHNEG